MPAVLTRVLAPALAALSATAVVTAVCPPPSSAAEVSPRSTLNRRLDNPSITESSGLARSTYARNVLWTHNDSGGSPLVYAVGKRGRTLATVSLRGASARDWEDISSGPGHKIWVGDVGNNSKARSVISVYRFTEPRRLTNRKVRNRQFDLRYPDGRHNSEGIMVNPVTGRLFVVSKDPTGGAIYRAPRRLSTGHVNQLKRVASAPAKITAASFYPDGRRFALCNYSTAWVYRKVGARPAARFGKPSLRQGESLEVNRGGTALFMGSEGRNSPVYRVVLR